MEKSSFTPLHFFPFFLMLSLTMLLTKHSVERMSRYRLRQLLKRNGIGVVAIARELDLTHGGVSNWFSGRSVSARIDQYVRAKAKEIQRSSK